MSVNTRDLIQPSTLNKMVQCAIGAQNGRLDLLNSAIELLDKQELSEEQKAKIASILGNVPQSTATEAHNAMRERILAILSGKDQVPEVASNGQVSLKKALQITPMNQEGHTCSSNVQTFVCIDQLIEDLIHNIFFQCQSKGDYEGIGRLACVNKHYNKCATAYWENFDLKFCPGLTILDAKIQGLIVDDEPQISKLAILKCFKKLVAQVENNAGLTLLTMTKGLTLNQLVKIAADAGMKVDTWDRILPELGDVPVEQTYIILITNSVFKESRKKCYNLQEEIIVGHGCEMPTVQEYVALCVFINKCFQKCLYGQNPWTFGRTSTHVGSYPLVVGGSALARLCVHNFALAHEFYGAGGRRKV